MYRLTIAALVEAHRLADDERPQSAGLLASTLHMHDVVSTELMANILRVSEVLNRAVHSREVTQEEAEAAIATGNQILADLKTIE